MVRKFFLLLKSIYILKIMISFRSSLLIFLLIGFSSCAAYWSGSLSSNLAIPIEKYHILKQVKGYARSFVFLGIIGGINHQNLVEEAKADLIRNNFVDSNQYWAIGRFLSKIQFIFSALLRHVK